MNNDIIYNYTNSIIADRFSGDRDYCRRSDTATDIRRYDCLCINYLFHCKILHTEEEMRPSRSLSFRRIYTSYNEKGVWNYGSKRTKKKTSRNENKTVRRYDASIKKRLRNREYQKGTDDHAEKTPENAV